MRKGTVEERLSHHSSKNDLYVDADTKEALAKYASHSPSSKGR